MTCVQRSYKIVVPQPQPVFCWGGAGGRMRNDQQLEVVFSNLPRVYPEGTNIISDLASGKGKSLQGDVWVPRRIYILSTMIRFDSHQQKKRRRIWRISLAMTKIIKTSMACAQQDPTVHLGTRWIFNANLKVRKILGFVHGFWSDIMWSVVFCGDLLLMRDVIDETIWILQISIASLQRLMSCREKDTFGGWICLAKAIIMLLSWQHKSHVCPCHFQVWWKSLWMMRISLQMRSSSLIPNWFESAKTAKGSTLIMDSSWNGGSCVPSSSPSYGCSIEVQQASGRWEWRLTYQDTVRTKMGDLDLLERAKRSRKNRRNSMGFWWFCRIFLRGECSALRSRVTQIFFNWVAETS